MSLTAISSLESARRKFSWTRRTSCLQSRNHLFLGSGCQNESNSHQLARIGEKKIFSWTRRTSCLQSKNHLFLGSGCQNESNSQYPARIWREENFSWTRRTSCVQSRNHLFLGSGCQNESNSQYGSPRIGVKNIFMNSTYIISTKLESLYFWTQDAKRV